MGYRRISKRVARKRYQLGLNFHIIAHKMRPGFPFQMGMDVFPQFIANTAIVAGEATQQTFDAMVNQFTYYNCSHETGYYPAFYIVEKGEK